jgi:hypothetical protein
MTTKKTGNSKTSSVQTLGLDDLDGIVGGAASPAPATHPHDPSQDQAFLNTLGNVAAVVSANATAVSSGHETAQAAISTVEAAAQAQHISTTAALTDLLGATHGNQTVATALTTSLVTPPSTATLTSDGVAISNNASAAAELVNLVATGHLNAADVTNIVQVATGTLAAYSKDGHSALGMSQNAAIDVIDSKIDTAAQNELISADFVGNQIRSPNSAAVIQGAGMAASNMADFIPAFESQNASHLATEQSIVALEGGATALQTGLNAAIANPLQGQGDTSFGLTATVADALGGQANPALLHQILTSSGVVSQLESVAHGGTLSSAGLSALENAAAQAHVSTDLTLMVAESVAQTSAVQQALVTEMTSRLVSGAAETELVNLAANGSLQVQDVNSIVSSVSGALAGLSADGHSALGMSQNAAIDVIDSKINTAAQNELISANFVGFQINSPNSATVIQAADAAASNMAAFIPAFESQNASHLAAAQSIVALEGGAAALQTGLNAAIANPLQGQNATVFGLTATVVADAFGGQANSALLQKILASSGVVSQLESVAHDGTLTSAGLSALENAAAQAHVSTDLTLALADEFSTNKGVRQALDTELGMRIADGALVGDIVNLAFAKQLQGGQDVTNIVSTVTGILASHSADGNTVAGTTQAEASDLIYANIDNQANTEAANFSKAGNTMLVQGNYGVATQDYIAAGVFAQFDKTLEINHGTDILTGLGVEAALKTEWAGSAVQIDVNSQPSLDAAVNQAEHVIETLAGQAYSSASARDVTLNAAATAFNNGLSLGTAWGGADEQAILSYDDETDNISNQVRADEK